MLFVQAQSQARVYEDKIRGLNVKVFGLEKENRRLGLLVGMGQLGEREALEKEVRRLGAGLAEAERQGAQFRRRFEILDKNGKKTLGGVEAKLRATHGRLFEAEQEIGRLNDILRVSTPSSL